MNIDPFSTGLLTGFFCVFLARTIMWLGHGYMRSPLVAMRLAIADFFSIEH